MAIVNQQVTTTQSPVLSVPTGKSYAITNILVCNTYNPNAGDAGIHDASFDLHIIPNPQELDNQVTCVIRELTLPAGETFTFDTERIVLEEGDEVILIGEPGIYDDQTTLDPDNDATDLAVTVSYLEV
jgi:hypothetical protein